MENLHNQSLSGSKHSEDTHPNNQRHLNPQSVSFEHLKELRDGQFSELANSGANGHSEKLTIEDTIPYTGADMSVEDEALDRPRREHLDEILNKYLPQRERQIIYMRFGLDSGTPMTLQEISKYFGVSSVRISQLEKKALDTLKRKGGNLLREVWEEDGHTTWSDRKPLQAVMDPDDQAMGVPELIKLNEYESSALNINPKDNSI